MTETMKPSETYGRGLYVGVLVFVSLLSVAGNAVYAYAAPAVSDTSLSPGWAAAAHMIPPITLLLVTEVLAMASSKFAGRGRAWALAGVVVIAAAAFALSFDALYEVAQMAKVRPELAWLVPVMLDVAIVVCTTLVLMASRQIQRDRVALVPTTGTPSITADEFLRVDSTPVDQHLVTPTSSPATTPTSWRDELADDLVATPSTSTDDLLDAATSWADEFVDEHPVDPVELSPATSSSPARHPADQPVRHDDDLDDTSATSSSIPVGDMPDDVVTSPTTSTVEVVDDVVATSDESIATPSTTPTSLPDDLVDDLDLGTDELGDELSVEVVGDLDEHRRRADEVVATSKISANADELATVLALDADGVSKQAIADRVGRSRSTVTGWLKTAADATPTESDRPIRPALVAVND